MGETASICIPAGSGVHVDSSKIGAYLDKGARKRAPENKAYSTLLEFVVDNDAKHRYTVIRAQTSTDNKPGAKLFGDTGLLNFLNEMDADLLIRAQMAMDNKPGVDSVRDEQLKRFVDAIADVLNNDAKHRYIVIRAQTATDNKPGTDPSRDNELRKFVDEMADDILKIINKDVARITLRNEKEAESVRLQKDNERYGGHVGGVEPR